MVIAEAFLAGNAATILMRFAFKLGAFIIIKQTKSSGCRVYVPLVP